ncbi:unnamed protein product [Cuscuta campestris]|uniref:Uncharacterized protein n=1 Tax=Cuscuta campestris TaxID=132261 RepID=A0A484KGX3_9ASTE|nr:unnamed protein product [Cuscuta campestris]
MTVRVLTLEDSDAFLPPLSHASVCSIHIQPQYGEKEVHLLLPTIEVLTFEFYSFENLHRRKAVRADEGNERRNRTRGWRRERRTTTQQSNRRRLFLQPELPEVGWLLRLASGHRAGPVVGLNRRSASSEAWRSDSELSDSGRVVVVSGSVPVP